MTNISLNNRFFQLMILALVTLGITSSCTVGSQLVKIKEQDPDGVVSIWNIENLEKEDTYSKVVGTAGSMLGPDRMVLGLRGNYQPIRLGNFVYTAERLIDTDISASPFNASYEAERSKVLKWNLSAVYDFPVYQRFGKALSKVPLVNLDTEISTHYTILDVHYADILAARVGGGHRFNNFGASIPTEDLTQPGTDERYTDDLERGMNIYSGTYVAQLGLSFSRVYGKYFRA